MEMQSSYGIAERLRKAGVPVTLQRLEIAQVLLTRPVHMAADQVLRETRARMPEVSRATVYNTLKLFCEKRLLRELIVDPDRVFYDSNTNPHFHIFDMTNGELSDVPAGEMQVFGLPALPDGVEVEQVDVVVRVRSARP